MSHKNLCCTLLKRLYRTSSEQVVHGGVGKMGFFSGFGYLVGGLKVWRFGGLEVWRFGGLETRCVEGYC